MRGVLSIRSLSIVNEMKRQPEMRSLEDGPSSEAASFAPGLFTETRIIERTASPIGYPAGAVSKVITVTFVLDSRRSNSSRRANFSNIQTPFARYTCNLTVA
jgi:hypothetical protein